MFTRSSIRIAGLGASIAAAALLTGCASAAAHGGGPHGSVVQSTTKKSGKTDNASEVASAMAAGDEATARGAYDIAVFEYVRALSVDPRNTEAYQKIARVETAQG